MYASNQYFDGQRASVGRIVVVNMGTAFGIQAGLIQAIEEGDYFHIALWDPSVVNGRVSTSCQFVPTKTEADIDAMPPNSWTWPVRV